MMDRRRALMADQTEPHVPNNLKAGSYTRGTSAATVSDNGNVTITAWGKGASNAIYIPLIAPISVASGDSIRMQVTKVSGSVSAKFIGYAYFGSTAVLANVTWNNGATAFDKTVTSSVTEDVETVGFRTNSDTITVSSYKIAVTIWINGVQVIPEV